MGAIILQEAPPRLHRKLAALPLSLLLATGCGEPPRGAAALRASLESIGNEMMAMHEPRRLVEYHDSSGKPYWLALIPPDVDAPSLAGAGIPGQPSCRTPDRTSVIVGSDGRQECVALARAALADLLVIHKQANETTRMTVTLDAGGYRVVRLE